MMTGAPVADIQDNHFSEDEQSPTDSSEDSVEVKVHPIFAPRQRQFSPTTSKGAKRTVPSKRKFPDQRKVDIYSPKYESEAGVSNFFPTSPATRSTFFDGTAVNVISNELQSCEKSQSATFAIVPKKRRLCEIKSESPSDIKQNLNQTPANELSRTDMHPPLSTAVTSPLYWLPPLDQTFPPTPQTHLTKDFYFQNELKHLRIPEFPPSASEIQQDEPLSLVKKRDKQESEPCTSASTSLTPCESVRTKTSPFCVESLLQSNGVNRSDDDSSPVSNRQKQRNYKNMTRERRIEANARERTRVHTISAAFDALRDAIPSYSHNQKLSKLSILKIASSYILTLGRIAGCDLSNDGSEPSIPSCVETLTQTIQAESKVRKRKDE